MELILSILSITMSVLIAIAMIYLYVKVFNDAKSREVQVNEMKSKIGQIIRDINNINRLEYEKDVNQQNVLDSLSTRILGNKVNAATAPQ